MHVCCTPRNPGIAESGVQTLQAPETGAPVMERVTGIEPAPSAWEAETLPLSYTRDAAAADQRNGSELVDVRGNA
jgi:hypothetical protein